MTKQELRDQLKLNLGMTTSKQDGRLDSIIESIIMECDKLHGVKLDIANRIDHALFVLDYATYRYSAMTDDMPMHILFRLRHLYLSEAHHVGT